MIVWDKNFPGIGSQSSPRVADLNQDGVDDIIVGACKNEYQPTDQGCHGSGRQDRRDLVGMQAMIRYLVLQLCWI